jgi:hypothetical protein
MEIALYIFYSFIGFLGFFLFLYKGEGLHSLFVLPISFLCFALLIFSKPELSLVWFNIGMLFYVTLFIIWDFYDKFFINFWMERSLGKEEKK